MWGFSYFKVFIFYFLEFLNMLWNLEDYLIYEKRRIKIEEFNQQSIEYQYDIYFLEKGKRKREFNQKIVIDISI